MRLKPWYDAYGGLYKDKYRFWTGLLLLVRCALALVVTFITDELVTLNILMWTCLILIPLVALLQVYNSTFLNVLEIVYLLFLQAIVFLATAKYNEQLYITMSMSLFCFFAILVFHSYRQVKSTRLAVFVCKVMTKMRKKPNATQELPQVNQEDEQRTQRNVPVSIVGIAPFDEDHEPLLAEADIS